MKYFLFIFSMLSFLYSKELYFSTLLLDRTSNVELEYKNMLSYLEKKTSYDFVFTFNHGYKDLVQKFGNEEIDIVALNAIEYVKLKRFFPYAKAIISFYDTNNNKFYTCNAITKNKNIKNLSQIPQTTLLRLLDTYSTCGYDIVEYILKQNSQNIKNFTSKPIGLDDDVILEIQLHPNNLGFEKSNTIEKYNFFNLHTIKTDFKVPPLAIIVNPNTVSNDIVQAIQKAFLDINPSTNKDDFYLVKNWNFSMQNGSFIPSERDYAHLYQVLHVIETSKDKR